MTRAEYDAIKALNYSRLKKLADSPLAYRDALTRPQVETPALTFGRAVHVKILEPALFDQQYVVRPPEADFRKTEWKQWRDDALGRGLEILSADDGQTLEEMAEAAYRHPVAADYLSRPGKSEHSLTWTDPHSGRLCKGRLDKLLYDGTILGYKTTSQFSQRQFQSQAWQLFYHAQWAFYRRAVIELGIHSDPPVIEIVQQKAPPYDVAVYDITAPIIDAGELTYREWLDILARCERTGEWPGAYPGLVEFLPPKWAQDSELGVDYFVNQVGGML